MAKHKGRNMRKAKIKKYESKMLKGKARRERFKAIKEQREMSKRIANVCPENSRSLNNDIGEYYSNMDCATKDAFNELVAQMESGEIYEWDK